MCGGFGAAVPYHKYARYWQLGGVINRRGRARGRGRTRMHPRPMSLKQGTPVCSGGQQQPQATSGGIRYGFAPTLTGSGSRGTWSIPANTHAANSMPACELEPGERSPAHRRTTALPPVLLTIEHKAGSLAPASRPLEAQRNITRPDLGIAFYYAAPSFQRSCRLPATMSAIVFLSRPRISRTYNCNNTSTRLLK